MAAPECLVATRRMQAFLESLDVPPRPAVAAAEGSLEATASVDADSDAAIQRALRAAPAFRAATLIVVAHRIGTIIDSDTILVLDAGRLVEAGSPAELLADDASHFAGLVKASGLGKSRSSSNLPGDTAPASS